MKLYKILVLLLTVSFVHGTVYAKNDKGHGKDKSLPPGLQKKSQRGQPLPPGWQKKLHKGDILDNSIYVRGKVVVPLGRDGIISINIEGTIIKLHEQTKKILDIIH